MVPWWAATEQSTTITFLCLASPIRTAAHETTASDSPGLPTPLHGFFRDQEEHGVLCFLPFHLSLAPYRPNPKAQRISKELFTRPTTMNFLLPPRLAGISKLPSSWIQVTEDALLQKMLSVEN